MVGVYMPKPLPALLRASFTLPERQWSSDRMQDCIDYAASNRATHFDAVWKHYRTCNDCRDYHYRLLDIDGELVMLCEGCGRTTRPACPKCSSADLTIEPMVNRAGVPGKRARCGCGNSRGDWFLTVKPDRRQPMAYIIRERVKACQVCAVELLGNDGEVDHIVALVDGGRDLISNLQRLCLPCHNQKHAGRFR